MRQRNTIIDLSDSMALGIHCANIQKGLPSPQEDGLIRSQEDFFQMGKESRKAIVQRDGLVCINDIYRLWRSWKQGRVRLSTLAAYDMMWKNHIRDTVGILNYVPSSQDMQSFIMSKLGSGLSRKSVQDIIILLKSLFRWGSVYGLCDMFLWDLNIPQDTREKKLPVLSVANERKLAEYLRTHITDRNLGILVAMFTGMRIGEVCALQWKDIDIGSRVIHVRKTVERIYLGTDRTKNKTQVVIGPPKTKQSLRDIPMMKELLDVLRPLHKVMNPDFFVARWDTLPSEPRIFRIYYHEVLDYLGIPRIKFHGLRHSFATRMLEAKVELKTVSTLLGHASTETTSDIYMHADQDLQRKALRDMGKLLKIKYND